MSLFESDTSTDTVNWQYIEIEYEGYDEKRSMKGWATNIRRQANYVYIEWFDDELDNIEIVWDRIIEIRLKTKMYRARYGRWPA